MNKVISQFSTRVLKKSLDAFSPGGKPATFSLMAYNHSASYASFYLRLKAAGAQATLDQDWYRVRPAQAYSIGPGDSVTFEAEILTLPPGREDFVGRLSLQAQTFSPELTDPQRPKSEYLTLYVIGKSAAAEALSTPEITSQLLLAPAKAKLASVPQYRWAPYVLGVAAVVLLIAIFLLRGHHATVKHAQFNTKGKVVSGAENGTLLTYPTRLLWRWPSRISHRFYHTSNSLDKHQAIEVVRHNPHKPTQVAVGFKNGDIALYDWDSKTNSEVRIYLAQENKCEEGINFLNQGDRIFSLAFHPTEKILYSAHGSGRVLQWDISKNDEFILKDCLQKAPNKTVTSVVPITINETVWLAIAGRYNHLTLLSLQGTSPQKLSPSTTTSVSGNSHIRSMASASSNRPILATGDDQGTISLWDVNTCRGLKNSVISEGCQPTTWKGHDGKPVRAVALSEDGRYLVSGGDDGKVKLWPLYDEERNVFHHRGDILQKVVVLRKSRKWLSFNPFKLRPIETVDLITDENSHKLFIVSGGEDTKVRIQQRRRP